MAHPTTSKLSTSPYSAREKIADNNKLGKSKKFIIIRSPPKTLSNSQSTMTIATPCGSAGNTAGNKSAPLFKNKIIPTINYSDESTSDGTFNNNNDNSTVIVQHPLETFVKADMSGNGNHDVSNDVEKIVPQLDKEIDYSMSMNDEQGRMVRRSTCPNIAPYDYQSYFSNQNVFQTGSKFASESDSHDARYDESESNDNSQFDSNSNKPDSQEEY